MHRLPVFLTLTLRWLLLGWALVSCLPGEALAQGSPSHLSLPIEQDLIFAAPPPPPDLDQPGQRTDAGSRGCEGATVPASSAPPLTALVPVYPAADGNNVFGLTAQAHPTFWFYVPFQPPYTGTFTLRDAAGQLVYEREFGLPPSPGIIQLTLPASAPPLALGNAYQWFLKIYCRDTPPPQFVNGWVGRQAPEPDLEAALAAATPTEQAVLYAQNGLWYDTLTVAAELQGQSSNPFWTNLLQAVDLPNLSAVPILDCCEWLEEGSLGDGALQPTAQ